MTRGCLWFTVYSLRFTDDYIGGDGYGLQFTVKVLASLW